MIYAQLLSIQVGQPQTRGHKNADDPLDEEWTSAIFKNPVDSPVMLRTLNLDGDRQADTKNHGGPHRAVMAYAAAHYPIWQQELNLDEQPPYGQFGENFTIDGLTEDTVCIGDVYAIGEAIVQVSQPRVPCWKIDRRWHQQGILQRVRETGRSGWYFRVLQEGMVEAGVQVERIQHPYPDWNIKYITQLLYDKKRDLDVKAQLVDCEELSPGWRDSFAHYVATFG